MTTTREQLGDEQYVRSRWEILVLDFGFRSIQPLHNGYGSWKFDHAPGWRKAADFTEQREREIQWKRQEIDWVDNWSLHIAADGYQSINEAIRKRILSLLESQLKELARGFKTPPTREPHE